MTRQTAIEFLTTHPDKYVKMLGFTKLGILHNCIDYLPHMYYNKTDSTERRCQYGRMEMDYI